MRCSENKIKAAILHPEPEVARVALRYFTDAFSADTSIMPLVIQAVEKHGRTNTFYLLRAAETLPQTPATVEWLVKELGREYDLHDVAQDNYRCAIALILCSADPQLLVPATEQVLSAPSFPTQLRQDFTLQAERAAWDWPTAWRSLHEWGEKTQGDFMVTNWNLRQAAAITRALGQFAEGAPTVLQLLHRNYRGHDKHLMQWLEPHLASLAGEMRLHAAIPLLVERLHEDDDAVAEHAADALAQIGTEEVLRALAKDWPEGGENYRLSAAETLEFIHGDLSFRTALGFLQDERQNNAAYWLGDAVLAQFDDEAIEPLRQLLLQNPGDDYFNVDPQGLRLRLVAAATIMEASFPEYPAWHAQAVEENWGYARDLEYRLADDLGPDSDLDPWAFPDDNDDLDDEEDFRQEPPPIEPIVNLEAKIGRNDPCPCGSGKKYKKCCLNKGPIAPAND